MRKTVKAVATAAILMVAGMSLVGCSQNKNYSFENPQVSVMPSWNEKSVENLKKEGWSFNVSKVFTDEVKDNPTIIFGYNKDKTCQISYTSMIDQPTNNSLGDEFNSQNYLVKFMQSSMSEQVQTAPIANTEIKSEGGKGVLSMVTAKYDTPYYGPNSQPSMNSGANSLKPEMPKSEGTIHNLTMSRMLSSNFITNPTYALTKASGNSAAPVDEKGTPVVSISYQCLNNQLDDKITNMIEKDATIILK